MMARSRRSTAWYAGWRLINLIEWVWEEFRVPISKQTLSREVRALGYRKLSARPRHHAKSEAEVSAFTMDRPCIARGLRQMGRDGSHQSIRPPCRASAPGHYGN